jgi:hypothetical protein
VNRNTRPPKKEHKAAAALPNTRDPMAERIRARRLPRGAGLMYLFYTAVERGESPDPGVVMELAALFRDVVAQIHDTSVNRAQRLIVALELHRGRGRRANAPTHEMRVALEVVQARESGGHSLKKQAEIAVANKLGLSPSTVRAYYAKHRATAEGVYQSTSGFNTLIKHLVARYGPDPSKWPEPPPSRTKN